MLDAFNDDPRIHIEAISGASAGAMNAVVFACGLGEGGRSQAKTALEKFWLSVSGEGSLAPAQRKFVDAWIDATGCMANPATQWIGSWARACAEFVSPYAFNPLNFNPLRQRLIDTVDFDRLNADGGLKLFIAATNVRTGRGEIFRQPKLTVDHVMASACLPQLFQAVEIDGEAYWDGGYAGNPPLWPLFYETGCHDAVIVQINPIERPEIPRTSEEISDRLNEVTFNASLLGELRAADFVARLIRSGVLKSDEYRLERLHRIGGAGRLAKFGAASKFDVSWPFLRQLHELGRSDARAWLDQNFDAIGVKGTLDMDEALQRSPPKDKAPATE